MNRDKIWNWVMWISLVIAIACMITSRVCAELFAEMILLFALSKTLHNKKKNWILAILTMGIFVGVVVWIAIDDFLLECTFGVVSLVSFFAIMPLPAGINCIRNLICGD